MLHTYIYIYIYCLWYHKFGAEIEEETGAHNSAKEIKLIYHIIFIKSNRTIGMANGAASRSKSLWIVVYKPKNESLDIGINKHKLQQPKKKTIPNGKHSKKNKCSCKMRSYRHFEHNIFSKYKRQMCEHCAHASLDMYIVHNRPHLSIWRVF